VKSDVKPEKGSSADVERPGLRTCDGARQSLPLASLAALLARPPLTVTLWVVAILSLGALALHLPERVNREDFSSYYASAWTLRAGGNPYIRDLDPAANRLGLHLGLLKRAAYTPTFILCFELLTFLRPQEAYWTWQTLNAIALCVAMLLLLGGTPGIGRREALVLAPLMLVYPPLGDHFAYGQCQFILLLMLALMLRSMERGWDATAGLFLALAGLLKAFPLIIGGYLLIRRRWVACLWLVIGLAAGAGLTFAIVGPRCLDFQSGMEFARGYEFLALPVNVSVAAMASRLFWYSFGPLLSPTLETARAVLAVTADLLVLAITVRATFAMSGRRDRDWRLFSLWVAAAILLSPTAWLHYLVLLFVPFTSLAAAASRGALSPRAVMTAVASYVLSLLSCIGMSCLAVLGSPPMQSLGRGPAWRVLDFHGWLMLAKEECAPVALLLAYMAIYWFVVDCRNGSDGETQVKLAAPIQGASRGSARASTHSLQDIYG
jgi:Glycosyltransferase family 87